MSWLAMKSFCNIHPVGTIVKKLLMTDHREIITEAKDKRGKRDRTTGQHNRTAQRDRTTREKARPNNRGQQDNTTTHHTKPWQQDRTTSKPIKTTQQQRIAEKEHRTKHKAEQQYQNSGRTRSKERPTKPETWNPKP